MCLSKLSYTNKSLGVRYWGKKLIGQESSKGTTSRPSLHTSQLEKECKKYPSHSIPLPVCLCICISDFSMANSNQLVADSTPIQS